MKKLWPAVVVAVAMNIGLVSAADTNWTGFYVGLNSGFNLSQSDAHYSDPAFRIYPIDSNPDGWSIGMQAGMNYQFANGSFDRVVLGFEAEVSYVDASDTIHDDLSDAHGRPNNSIKTSSNFACTIRARFGYAVGPFLPYVTAGLAGTDAKVSATDGPLEQTDLLPGWIVGAGVEYALAKNWSVRAEYLHVDLGRHTWFEGAPWESSSLLTSDTLRFGVNFRF
jgi:outer membrane immunogenic protein